MEKVKFQPWVGNEYWNEGLYGLKVLLLGESHYGEKLTKDSEVTKNVVMELGITGKHRFFTILAKSLSLDSSAALSSDDKKHFWDKVAFYNFCQEIVAEKARKSPSPQIWKLSTEPFYKVLNELKPDLVLVLGKRLSYNLPKIPNNIKYKVINHPSSGFSYARWIPQIKEALINSGAKFEHKL